MLSSFLRKKKHSSNYERKHVLKEVGCEYLYYRCEITDNMRYNCYHSVSWSDTVIIISTTGIGEKEY